MNTYITRNLDTDYELSNIICVNRNIANITKKYKILET